MPAKKVTKKTPVKKTATKATKTKAATTAATTPAAATPVAATPVAATPTTPPASTTPNPSDRFDELMDNCIKLAQAQVASSRSMVSSIRATRKAHDRVVRDLQKNSKRRRQKTDGTPKPLTGFAKPCRISDKLADFLHDVAGNDDVSRGMEMSRTDVTRRLNNYFIENDLRDPEDKRTILYKKDSNLDALLGKAVPSDTKLTYFNLQSVLKDQFIKAQPLATQ